MVLRLASTKMNIGNPKPSQGGSLHSWRKFSLSVLVGSHFQLPFAYQEGIPTWIVRLSHVVPSANAAPHDITATEFGCESKMCTSSFMQDFRFVVGTVPKLRYFMFRHSHA